MSPDERLSPQVDLEHPWLGLESFGESTRSYFFGRDAEAAELLQRLQLHPLLVFYGRSGLGKTSLLRARLVPDLEKLGGRPAFYRISYRKEENSPLNQLAIALGAGGRLNMPGFALPEDAASRLWLRLHRRERKNRITHLILDQFEEIFTIGSGWPGADAEVRQVLAILVQGAIPPPVETLLDEGETFLKHFQLDVPPLPVLLCLRQDYVFALNRWRSHLPQLGQNNFELRVLRHPAAFDAVFKPGELRCRYRGEVSEETKADTGLPPIVTQETAQRIVRFVAQKGGEVPIEEIEAVPPILSLLCRELNARRFTKPAGTPETPASQITFRESEADIETIIAAFYERCLAGRPEAVRIFTEEDLVTYSGARLQQDQRSILKVFTDGCKIPGASDDRRAAGYGNEGAARACLEELVNQRLFTAVSGGENPTYELVHDLLAGVVEKSRIAREEHFEKERADRRAETEKKAKEEAKRKQAEAEALAASEQRRRQRLPILPPNASFLAALQADNVVGPPDLADDEKKMLLGALRFYFGPAQWWNAVGKDKGMGPLRFYFRSDLGPGYFSHAHPAPDQVKLQAIRLKNKGKPSYFLYEANHNLMLYVGLDFQTGAGPKFTVINTLVLDRQHRPLSSHTLQFWFEEAPMTLPESLQDKLQTDSVVGQLNSSEKEMLVGALRFYFGPAQFKHLKAVAKVKMKTDGLDKQQQTGLGEGSSAPIHGAFSDSLKTPADDVELHVAIDTRNNDDRLPSYVLEEAHHKNSFYVGPDFGGAGPTVKVINATPLDNPQSNHPLKFKFMDFGTRTVSTGLPELRVEDVVGDQLAPDEKQMLLGALRFYFRPAQSKYLKAVAKEENLGRLQFYFRSGRWERWRAVLQVLDKDLCIDAPSLGEVTLRAAKRHNPENKPSYFLYASYFLNGPLQNLMLYVGPDFQHGRSALTVINTLVLDDQHVPQSSHTLDFGFLDRGPHEVSEGLDGAFLGELQAADVVGPQDPTDPEKNLTDEEKEMLLGALRFYFGPATNFWGAVTKDKLTPDNLNDLNADLRKPGERYEILELQTGLGLGYFASTHQVPDQVNLYAAKVTPKDNNDDRLASYFLYEARSNLTFYVGPDFLHGRPTVKVINTLVLDERHVALSSHTLDFGFEP